VLCAFICASVLEFSPALLFLSSFTLLSYNDNLHAQASKSGMFFYALHAPNYSDSADVGRHAAYATILTKLLDNRFSQGERACSLSSGMRFPDLQLRLEATAFAGPEALKGCLERTRTILENDSFDQAAFDAAVQEAMRSYRPFSFESGDLTRANLAYMRLQLLARLALRQLRQSDPVLHPLLTIHDQLLSRGGNHADFMTWVAAQRSSSLLGFYSLLSPETELYRRFGFAMSPPSIRPVLERPSMDGTERVHVRAPSAGQRPFALVRCDSHRDQSCVDKLRKAFCSKTVDELSPQTHSQQSYAQTQLKCAGINIEGLVEWMAIEADDEAALKWFVEEVPTRRLSPSDVGPEFLDFVILVTPNK
jgi:hypothetical protein